jgi:hypothetical protein
MFTVLQLQRYSTKNAVNLQVRRGLFRVKKRLSKQLKFKDRLIISILPKDIKRRFQGLEGFQELYLNQERTISHFNHQQHLLRAHVRHRVMHHYIYRDMAVVKNVKQQSVRRHAKESTQ